MIDQFRGEYRWLSNFYPCIILMDGIVYKSTEAAFQAAKTLSAEDRRAISKLGPADAKRTGRQVKLRPDWERVKNQVMLDINRQKFTDQDLRQKLIDTGNEELVEGNTWNDRIWGVCNGVGENRLGKILMQIRGEINAMSKPRDHSGD